MLLLNKMYKIDLTFEKNLKNVPNFRKLKIKFKILHLPLDKCESQAMLPKSHGKFFLF